MKPGLRRIVFLAGITSIAACGGGGGNDLAVAPSPIAPDVPTPETPPGETPSEAAARIEIICPLCNAPDTDQPITGPSTPPEPGEKIGVFSGYSGIFNYNNSNGDGSVGGGGDGEGGVGAGGSLGRFLRGQVTATLDDGMVLGEAPTDGRGLVTIYPGRGYKGGLKIELRGLSETNYFDEAKSEDLPFPSGERIRVHIDRIRSNIAITPFTEAAVQFQASPLLAHRTPQERLRIANAQVRQQINNQLPTQYALSDITTLPVLVGPDSINSKTELNTLTTETPSGRYGSVIAGLSIAAGQFNNQLVAPGYSIAKQIVVDLTDGRLDGAGPGGAALAPDDELAYLVEDLPSQLIVGIELANSRYGQAGAPPTTPTTLASGAFQRSESPNQFTPVELRSDGSVISGATELPGTTSPAIALFSDGFTAFIRRASGTIEVMGLNTVSSGSSYHRYGLPSPDNSNTPVPVTTLAGINAVTHISVGSSHSLARTISGGVLAWGANDNGQLAANVPSSSVPVAVPLSGAGVKAVGAGDGHSIALTNKGRVITWGDRRYVGQGSPDLGPRGPATPGEVQQSSPRGPLENVTSIVATETAGFAINADGYVWCWGNDANLLANNAFVATQLRGLIGIRKITRTENGLVALNGKGDVWYWGASSNESEFSSIVQPTRVPGIGGIRDLVQSFGVRGRERTLAIDSNNREFEIVPPGVVAPGPRPTLPPNDPTAPVDPPLAPPNTTPGAPVVGFR